MQCASVYAEQLGMSRRGLPLWYPEPQNGEVEIGDVGLLHDGGFHRFFNVLFESEHPFNTVYGVPEHFQPLRAGMLPKTVRDPELDAGLLTSKSVKATQIQLSAEGGAAGGSAGVAWSFQSSKSQGALLVLKYPAKKEIILPNRGFTRYMRQNYKSWHHFATEILGLECEAEDIVLVHGWTKAASWTVAAFQSEARAQAIRLNGNINLMAGVGLEVAVIDKSDVIYEQRSGPQPTSAARGPGSSTSSISPPRDQCIFLSTYRWKSRFLLPRHIVANASPSALPDPDHDNPSEQSLYTDGQIEAQSGSLSYNSHYEALFQYILENSDAEYAIISDQDIADLYEGEDQPEDLGAYLRDRRPEIDVHDSVGTLSIKASIRRSRLREAALLTPDSLDSFTTDHPRLSEFADSGTVENGRLVLGCEASDAAPTDWPHFVLVDKQHEVNSVTSIAIAQHGPYLASGSEDCSVRLWNLESSKMENIFEGHEETVWAVAFSPNGNRLVSVSADSKGIIWDMNDIWSHQLAVLDGHDGEVVTVTYSPNGALIATGSLDCTARIWNADDGAPLFTLNHALSVMVIGFSPDGNHFMTCADATARIWDPYTGNCQHVLAEHAGSIWSISFSPDSERVITGSEDTTARVWSVLTGDELVILREHTGGIWCVAFSPDGKEVASGSYDGAIAACDSFTGERHCLIEERPSVVNALAYSSDGNYIASGSSDGFVKVWEIPSGEFIAEFQGHKDKVKAVKWSSDDKDIASLSDDGSIRVWSFRDTLRLIY